ncbi:hypothetical protein NE237_015679 [Protea cynaroides]|uniref:DUF4283 domain-containing protein n=1 Tax=Protea cynaroides TaxID=273540 RepID=A0A9Q0KE96_9MAGN|nr:hypothetical protein NE237_015679 [Protea cynaroides]
MRDILVKASLRQGSNRGIIQHCIMLVGGSRDKEVSLKAREGLNGVRSDSRGRMGNPPQSLSMPVLGVDGLERDQPAMVFSMRSDGAGRESLDSGAFDGATFYAGNQGAALAMVIVGMGVDPGIRESFVSSQAGDSSGVVVSNKGSDSFLADNLLSNADDLQSIRRAIDGSLWMPVPDGMLASPSGMAIDKSSDNSELERASVDLGKFLVSVNTGVAREKGKNVMEGSNHPNGGAALVSNANGVWGTVPPTDSPAVMPGVNGSNNSSGATKSGISFALVPSGLQDLSSLPEPVTEGGLSRVVIPQVIYETPLEKYRLANKGVKRINGQPLRLQRWEPNFDVNKVRAPHHLQWVRLSGLGIELWDQEVIFSIGKALGTPIRLDRNTQSKTYGRSARFCVDMVSGGPRPEEIMVECCCINGQQSFFKQPTDMKHPCTIYGTFHGREDCPMDMRVPPGNKSDLGPWADVENEVDLDDLEDGEVRTLVMDFDDHVSVPQHVDVNVSIPQRVDVTIAAWPVDGNTKEVQPNQGNKQGAFPVNGIADGDFTGSAIEIWIGMGPKGASIVFSSPSRVDVVFDDVSAIVRISLRRVQGYSFAKELEFLENEKRKRIKEKQEFGLKSPRNPASAAWAEQVPRTGLPCSLQSPAASDQAPWDQKPCTALLQPLALQASKPRPQGLDPIMLEALALQAPKLRPKGLEPVMLEPPSPFRASRPEVARLARTLRPGRFRVYFEVK